MAATVYIENSKTPIYQRIAHSLGAELARRGMNVLVVKPDGFDVDSFRRFLVEQTDAVYISNAEGNVIQSRLPNREEYFFEHFPGKLIFVHQDAILGGPSLLAALSKLQAWQRVGQRAAHLCLEPANVAELGLAGIPNARVAVHASETPAQEPAWDAFRYHHSFVGHVVPSQYRQAEESARVKSLVDQALQARCDDFGTSLDALVEPLANQSIDGVGPLAEQAVLKVACTRWLRGQISRHSLTLRGWVFENCALPSLDIFGGDPSYLHGVESHLTIEGRGLVYHPPCYDPAALLEVFRNSAVSINVSSPQFDHAVVNRFHDVTLAGGLCLTDQRPGLAELTTEHAEISYRTVAELHDRATHFSRPENFRRRALLIKALQRDVARHSGYPLLAQNVIDALSGLR